MKARLFDKHGKEKDAIELPSLFDTKIREDIVAKCFEAEKIISPYATKERAGLRQSAAGKISHKRHDWKGHYGRGISRMPRKTMYRHGEQFFWIAANVPGTRQGRRAHPPQLFSKDKKINKKEIKIALNSGFAATANPDYLIRKYSSLEKIDSVPFVIEELPSKTKELKETFKIILEQAFKLAFKNKVVRAGKGKLRGRKYKSNSGVLIVVSSNENKKFKGLEIKTPKNIKISDLYPLGRLTVYTQKALEELEKDTIQEARK